MRWTTTMTTLLLAAVMAGPALAQEAEEAKKGHDEKKAGHHDMEMRMTMMHGAMPGMLAGHAEQLGLTDDQADRLEALDERLKAEMERHHQEMHSIHEAAMGVLTDEQRRQVAERMKMHPGHGGDHGERKAGGEGEEDPGPGS